MVKAIEWINQNYPENDVCQRKEDKENYGKRREEIFNLDISNQNLEGDLGSLPRWINLRKLNVSFNKNVNGLVSDNWSILEEIDYSHNQRGGMWGINGQFFQLRKLNLSHNQIEKIDLFQAPHLTHLDVSGNSFTELDLRKNRNLVKLDCSDNPINDLSLTYSPHLKTFDCLGVSFSETNSTITDSKDNLIITSGIGVAGWLAFALTLCYKWRRHTYTPIGTRIHN